MEEAGPERSVWPSVGLLPGEPPAAARCLSCAPVWPWQAAFDTYDHGCIGTGRWGHPTLKPSPLGTHIRFPLASRRWGTIAVTCVYFQTHPHAPMPEEALTFRRQDCWGVHAAGLCGGRPSPPGVEGAAFPGDPFRPPLDPRALGEVTAQGAHSAPSLVEGPGASAFSHSPTWGQDLPRLFGTTALRCALFCPRCNARLPGLTLTFARLPAGVKSRSSVSVRDLPIAALMGMLRVCIFFF